MKNENKDSYKVNLDELIHEFVNMVSEDATDISTDPNVKKVKVIRVNENDCPGCGLDFNKL